MLDLGWQELLVIVLVAVIVISPKELPQAIRAVTQFARHLRGLSREFRSGVSELVREAELDELKHQVEKAGRLDHLSDPTGHLTEEFDPKQFADELKRRVNPDAPSDDGPGKKRARTVADPISKGVKSGSDSAEIKNVEK